MSSTLLTLYVVPVIYTIFERRAERRRAADEAAGRTPRGPLTGAFPSVATGAFQTVGRQAAPATGARQPVPRAVQFRRGSGAAGRPDAESHPPRPARGCRAGRRPAQRRRRRRPARRPLGTASRRRLRSAGRLPPAISRRPTCRPSMRPTTHGPAHRAPAQHGPPQQVDSPGQASGGAAPGSSPIRQQAAPATASSPPRPPQLQPQNQPASGQNQPAVPGQPQYHRPHVRSGSRSPNRRPSRTTNGPRRLPSGPTRWTRPTDRPLHGRLTSCGSFRNRPRAPWPAPSVRRRRCEPRRAGTRRATRPGASGASPRRPAPAPCSRPAR